MDYDKHLKQMLKENIITKDEYETITKRMDVKSTSPIDCTWGNLIENFYSWCQSQYSLITAKGYRTCVNKFVNYLALTYGVQNIMNDKFRMYSFQDVNSFIEHMREQGLTKQTISKNKYAVIILGEYLKTMEVEVPDVAVIKTSISNDDKITFALTQDEIFNIADVTDIRSKICILLCYECALKRTELVKCKVTHFNFDTRQLIVYGNDETIIDRVCVISDRLSNLIQAYIDELYQDIELWNKERISKGREPRIDKGYLFQSIKTTVPSYSVLQTMLKKSATLYYKNKLNDSDEIKDRISKFTFENIRNSRRVYLLAHGKDIREVMNMCGDRNYMTVHRFQKLVPLLYPECMDVD